MPDPTAAERQRRYRERQVGNLAPAVKLTCLACGKRHTGARGLLVCARCWERLTPEGRLYKADRVARSRARSRARDGL